MSRFFFALRRKVLSVFLCLRESCLKALRFRGFVRFVFVRGSFVGALRQSSVRSILRFLKKVLRERAGNFLMRIHDF